MRRLQETEELVADGAEKQAITSSTKCRRPGCKSEQALPLDPERHSGNDYLNHLYHMFLSLAVEHSFN